MSKLRVSRAEQRSVLSEMVRDEYSSEDVMMHSLRSYKSGYFGRVRVRAKPKLPRPRRASEGPWRYIVGLRISLDLFDVFAGASQVGPLLSSLSALLPFAIGLHRGAPRFFWLAESGIHLLSDIENARWANFSLSLLTICCCLSNVPIGDSSERS